MKDKCDREIKHIRLSVTENCGYNCIYCDKEGFIPRDNELSVNEIIKLTQLLAEVLEVSRIKLTGGEPLCRKEIVEIVKGIKDLGLYDDISMTTNGYFLFEKAEALHEAGLDRINVSLPSLNPETYKKITGSDGLNRVIQGIKKATQVGLIPIKINYVVLRGLNESELEDMIKFSAKHNVVLQLIELHARSDAVGKQKEFYERYHIDLEETIYDLEDRAFDVKVRGMMQNRKVIFLPNGAIIEAIHPGHDFCMGCTKLRVGCDGNVFGCLYRADSGRNVKDDLQGECSVAQFKNAIKHVVHSREPYY
ncbi:MAG: GTP 3',8-cyclase MoaA [Candidatus Lokiarchaeota archaeon]|nr:GTP 3',8-cyclase MoaA [Candidatus Lokiarchaeota archaeon]